MSEQVMKFSTPTRPVMKAATSVKAAAAPKYQPMQDKALRHLADSIYRQLQSEGCHAKDIIGVSSQLLSLVTTDLGAQKKD